MEHAEKALGCVRVPAQESEPETAHPLQASGVLGELGAGLPARTSPRQEDRGSWRGGQSQAPGHKSANPAFYLGLEQRNSGLGAREMGSNPDVHQEHSPVALNDPTPTPRS